MLRHVYLLYTWMIRVSFIFSFVLKFVKLESSSSRKQKRRKVLIYNFNLTYLHFFALPWNYSTWNFSLVTPVAKGIRGLRGTAWHLTIEHMRVWSGHLCHKDLFVRDLLKILEYNFLITNKLLLGYKWKPYFLSIRLASRIDTIEFSFIYFQDISEYKCENDKPPMYVPHKPVTGVIGASFSVVSIMVANILRLFKVSRWKAHWNKKLNILLEIWMKNIWIFRYFIFYFKLSF